MVVSFKLITFVVNKLNMNSGIYKIVNLQTGKYYVGSTKDFKRRKQILVIENNKIIEFNNQLEASIYLSITKERVRQILKLGSKKFEIRYKYPELQ